MATIVITSCGTLGDHLPYVALGQALKARGHRVCMAISRPMHSYAVNAGLEAVACGWDMGQEEAHKYSQDWDHWSPKGSSLQEKLLKFQGFDIPGRFRSLLAACQDADLLISNPMHAFPAAMVCEKTAIPLVVAFMSVLSTKPLTEISKQIINQPNPLEERLDEDLQKLREEAGLVKRPRPWSEGRKNLKADQTILAISPHFFSENSPLSANMTGFWFYEDPVWSNWQPSAQLQEFFQQDQEPLVLAFSSQPLKNPREVVEVHVRAAAKLGRPILIQHGWADFSEDHLPADIDRTRVMFAGFLPQDWLFARAAAVIHHGGIGTTARALRHGCPMLVEPYGNDQFINAKQVLLLGVGSAAHPHKLNETGLVQILTEKVLTPEYRRRAEEIGGKIRQEKGLITACDLIESSLSTKT
ncbi:glycosyltransferase [Nostoc sp.]|uniref:glycosyltransferase n=1 Tax=Nostoc sp. TaxID=1180 RepID=UPI002FF95347